MCETQTSLIMEFSGQVSSMDREKAYIPIYSGYAGWSRGGRGRLSHLLLVECVFGKRMVVETDMVIGLIVVGVVLACLTVLVAWSVRSIERMARSGVSTARRALKGIKSGK